MGTAVKYPIRGWMPDGRPIVIGDENAHVRVMMKCEHMYAWPSMACLRCQTALVWDRRYTEA